MNLNDNSLVRRAQGAVFVAALAIVSMVIPIQALADGSETLGPPSIGTASGSIVAAGTGLVSQPGQIDIVVPAGAAVLQVLLYWDGDMTANVPGDDLATVNGIPVTGQLIGGPTFFFSDNELGDAWVSSFRADITDLGLVGPGANTLTIEDVDFTRITNGAGALVIYDDGSGNSAEVRDGLDLAFVNFSAPLDRTELQTFSFPSAGIDRTAKLSMFFSSVSMTNESRPTSIEVRVGGTVLIFSNLLDGNDGEEWDTVNLNVPVPAGAGVATVRAFSRDDENTGNLPASFAWVAAIFSVPPDEPVGMVGDLVFEDEDADGLQCRDLNGNQSCDAGEPLDPGLPGVKVNLTSLCDDPADDVDPNDPTSMQRTDGTGFYKFMGLPSDCKYTVTVDDCNFDSAPGALCGDGGPAGALEGLVPTPPQIGNDECDDSGGLDGQGQPVDDMAMTRLPLDPPFVDGQNALNDPCLDFGYFPPPVMVEKFTNGHDADAADGFPTTDPGNFDIGGATVPLVGVGEKVTWSYDVTNPGPETLVNVVVSDDQPGVSVTCPTDTLLPGQTIRCMAMGFGLDLAQTGGVPGCNAQGQGDPVPTYENVGTVNATVDGTNVEVTDSDPSHYCNPPDVMVEKFTNGHDGDDASGFPDAGPGNFSVGGSTVAEIAANEPITWTYRVTNTGTEDLVNVVVTDSRGVTVDCPTGDLPMGQTITCTATGFADDLFSTGGDVDGCDAQGQGNPRPTYENLATVVGSGATSGVVVTDDDPSHYCNPELPPECGLTIQKGCELPPPPAPPEGKCQGRLQEFTMVWTGGPITVSGPPNNAPGGQVANGDVVSFFGPFSDNDVIVNLSGASNGQSKFHTSCSDRDMDGDTTTNEDQQQVSSFGRDCGKFQGDGKGSTGINDWLLEGFVDADGAVLDCTTDTGGPLASVCEFSAIPVDCDTLGKPSNLTFVYTGGGCPGDNDQGSKTDCSGSIDGGQAVTVTLDGGTLGPVNLGDTFNVSATGSNTTIALSNGGGTQTNDVHTSCSAPLAAGDVFGGMTLVALDGVGIGTDVTYSYLVSNDGPATVTDIIVTDDQLGGIGTIASLAPGDSQTLTADAFISETTTNVGAVDGIGAPGAVCLAESSPVVVQVLPPPPCDVSIVFEKIEKDVKIKWKLTNDSAFGKATLETFQLDFPAGFGAIKKVKLDGDTYKADDSDLVVGPGVTIGPDDWTQSDVAKRELDQGETRTLEVEFEEKVQDTSPGDFDLILTFEEGCIATF